MEEKKELVVKKAKPIDIINNIDKDYTPAQVERAWVETLSTQAPKQWLKNVDKSKPDNPFMKDGKGNLIPYMPIEITEMLMDKLLMHPQWKITNSGLGQVQSEKGLRTLAYMNVELKYFDHGLNDWCYESGTASMEVSGNFQWSLVFPKLHAEAKKNACKSLGNLFGRRIGREDMVITEEQISVKKSAKEKVMEDLKGGKNENN